MRKMRCLFSAALLAVAAAVAVPAMAAEAPAGAPAWAAWWQELSVWIDRLSPFGGNGVAAKSDTTETTADGAEGDGVAPPPPGDGPVLSALVPDEEQSGDSLPGVDPNG